MSHRTTFRQLHSLLLQAQEEPYTRASVIIEIQEILVRRIRYTERRIRVEKKAARIERASMYQDLLYSLKTFGDGIAFLFIDRWDIKPLARNHAPGFISGKTGFTNELKFLRKGGHLGPVLLADLTNCLRHGDIYAFSPEKSPLILEMKSSKAGGSRSRRQMQRNYQLMLHH